MIHRGSRPRESKNFRKAVRTSTLEDKLRRHRNKKRIWRRAVKRFALQIILEAPTEAVSFSAAV